MRELLDEMVALPSSKRPSTPQLLRVPPSTCCAQDDDIRVIAKAASLVWVGSA